MIKVTRPALAAHPFPRGMPRGHLDALAAAASYVTFPAGHRIFGQGGYASRFWLIQSGHVALGLYVPGEGPAVTDTVRMGEVPGWSWLFPPYRRAFGAACASAVGAFESGTAAVRARCVAGPVPGYQLTRRLAEVLARRLQATRARLIARSRGTAALY